MRCCLCVTELLSSDPVQVLSFDLLVYYLPANSFIFNLFSWPAAMDSDTVIFFTRACHTSLWIIWSYSWDQCYHSYLDTAVWDTQATRRHPLSQLPSCSHFAAAILNLFWLSWDYKMVQMKWRQLCDLDNKWWYHRARCRVFVQKVWSLLISNAFQLWHLYTTHWYFSRVYHVL